MRIVLAWSRLELRRRWRSLGLLALLVAVSTATVLAAAAGARRGETAYARLWARSLPATVTVLPNQPGFDWARIRARPEVAALTTFAVTGAAVAGLPAAQVGFPPGDGQVMRTIERPPLLRGRLFSPRRADEVVVTPLFQRNFGKGVGSTVLLRLPAPSQSVAGYDGSAGPPRGPAVRVRIVGVVRSSWFSDAVGDPGGVIPSPALLSRYHADLMGTSGQSYLNALVRLRGGTAAIPAFRADLARVSGRSDIDVWDNYHYFGGPQRKVTGYEAVVLAAFGLAALVAALLLVGQLVVRYASAATAELGVLRPVGMTPRQAIAAASAGPLLAAVAGASLGVGGAVLASAWLPIGAASLLEPHPGIDADWLVLGTGWAAVPLLVLGGAAAAAAAALASARAGSRPRRSAVTGAVARAGLPVPALVGTRFALEPGHGRSAVPVRPAIAGAVAGVLGVIAAFTFSAGVSDAAANPQRFGQTTQLEAYLGLNGQEIGPSGRLLRTVAADRDVTGLNDTLIGVAQAGGVSVTAYSYRPVGGKRLPVVLTSGRMPAAADQAVLAATTARQLRARPGSVVRFTGGTVPAAVTVTGIGFVPEGSHNDYDSGAWLTPAGFGRLFRGAHYPFKFRTAEVALRPGADPAAVARRLNSAAAAIGNGQAYGFTPPQPPEQLKEIRDVAQLPLALGGFLALLAAGAVGHALVTAVRRRGHELAVLRALGLTPRQARLVLATQATLLALAGLALGVPLGLALGRAVWRAVAGSTPLAYHPPLALWALVLIAPAALLAANLLAAWPGHRAARLRSGRLLRAE